MPTKRFALEKGGTERVEVSWTGSFKNTTVTVDGLRLLTVSTRAELQAGRSINLRDGSRLEVKLAREALSSELQVTRNGFPLPGSASDPDTVLKTAYGIIFFIAGLSALAGLATMLFQVEFLQNMGFGLWSVVFGGVFALLGYFVQKRSAVALGIAIGLFALDAIALLFTLGSTEGGSPPIGALIVRAFFLAGMARGFGAIRSLKEQDRQDAMTQVF